MTRTQLQYLHSPLGAAAQILKQFMQIIYLTKLLKMCLK